MDRLFQKDQKLPISIIWLKDNLTSNKKMGLCLDIFLQCMVKHNNIINVQKKLFSALINCGEDRYLPSRGGLVGRASAS